MEHHLNLAVANAIEARMSGRAQLIRAVECGGNQQLPLFVGIRKSRGSRMCCVDLLVIQSGRVRVIVEIEESGFLPTKLCGKFLQAAIANHFIHDSHAGAIPYGEQVLFLQVLDASKCLRPGTRKDVQADLIAAELQGLVPVKSGSISGYRLFLVWGERDYNQLNLVADASVSALSID